MKARRGFYFGRFALLGIAGIIAFTFVVMWLWNWLVPEVFSGPLLTYWQTLGLLVLSKILFSGIGGRGHRRHHYDHSWKSRDRWKKKFDEKMNGKTGHTKGSPEGTGSDEAEVIET